MALAHLIECAYKCSLRRTASARTVIYTCKGLSVHFPPSPPKRRTFHLSLFTAPARLRFSSIFYISFYLLSECCAQFGWPFSFLRLASFLFNFRYPTKDNPLLDRYLLLCFSTPFSLPSFLALQLQPTTGPNPAPQAPARTNLVTERIPLGQTLSSYVPLVMPSISVIHNHTRMRLLPTL
jgi:hypothetical protein